LPDVIVDIADTLEIKARALLAHRSQVDRESLDRMRERARRLGQAHGLGAAEAFQLIRQD
jgi:LmbE family N-acetylglucosaminyl deacetylase